MQQTILAISGKPGLYKLVSRGKNNLIVEALDATHKRMPAFASDRITSLADIAMFTERTSKTWRKARKPKSIPRKPPARNYKTTSPVSFPNGTATASMSATSRNSSVGTIY